MSPPGLNWGATINQTDHIRRLNLILKTHPAFADNVRLALVQKGEGNYLVLCRTIEQTDREVIVVANLDCANSQTILWQARQKPGDTMFDLCDGSARCLPGLKMRPSVSRLNRAGVMALTRDQRDLDRLKEADLKNDPMPLRVVRQKTGCLCPENRHGPCRIWGCVGHGSF